jgi:hypothetical protein
MKTDICMFAEMQLRLSLLGEIQYHTSLSGLHSYKSSSQLRIFHIIIHRIVFELANKDLVGSLMRNFMTSYTRYANDMNAFWVNLIFDLYGENV